MKKIILTYGLISGVIVAGIMLLSMNYFSHCEGSMDFNSSMVVGYASMLLAFSLVFVGVKQYRDKFNAGQISFGKAFRIGFFIVLVASTMYVVAWLFNYYLLMPDFLEKYSAHMLEEMKAQGASAEKIQKESKEMASFAKMYQNPFFNALMTYLEILPMGLIVTLISAFILKRRVQESLNP
ncbi:MAG: DUF4199 domain-containing protein [Chitinophagaceae bacterium]